MGKHTQGPWVCGKNYGCKQIKGGKSGKHKQARYKEIANTVGLWDESEDAANAALIASAPVLLEQRDELLEALNALLNEVGVFGLLDELDADVQDKAVSAIANATKEAASEN